VSDESLFREVDEEVRREQMEKLWKRYGTLIMAVAFGIIAGVAGYKGWQYYSLKQAEDAGAAFLGAVEQAEKAGPAENIAMFDGIAKGSHGGFALLARFQVAGNLAAEGKTDEAVKAFDALAADSSADQAMRDMARMRAGYLLVDELSSSELRSRLAGLDVDGSPWRASAREVIALALYREGNYLEADKLVSQILIDPETPSGVRQRAQVIASLLRPLLGEKASQ
jgi:hypothetical protein